MIGRVDTLRRELEEIVGAGSVKDDPAGPQPPGPPEPPKDVGE
jgi:hypothetical protein